MRRPVVFLIALLLCLGGGPGVAQEGAHPHFLLVAKPDMPDPLFRGTVILVTRHGGRAPTGVILNKPTRAHLNDLFHDLPELDEQTGTIYFGGPVSPEVLAFMVKTDTPPEPALTITRDVYLALDPDLLRGFIGHPEQRRQLRVFSGYAGWAPGQLQAEITRGDWWAVPLRAKYLFPEDPDTLWERMVQELQGKWVQAPMSVAGRAS